jgi:RNA binding exosome subunit
VVPQKNEVYDVFICHATEDKDDVVRILAHRLSFTHGLKVFYDELSLDIGDSLREKINEG